VPEPDPDGIRKRSVPEPGPEVIRLLYKVIEVLIVRNVSLEKYVDERKFKTFGDRICTLKDINNLILKSLSPRASTTFERASIIFETALTTFETVSMTPERASTTFETGLTTFECLLIRCS
jgi:hypothetical protein